MSHISGISYKKNAAEKVYFYYILFLNSLIVKTALSKLFFLKVFTDPQKVSESIFFATKHLKVEI